MRQENDSFIPKCLGYLGLIPFIVITLFLFFDDHHFTIWQKFLISYSAVILSFVGALQWAFSMTLIDLSPKHRKWMLIWSVIPSLTAWLALLISETYALTLLSIFFGLSYIVDNKINQLSSLQTWYIPMRFKLTCIVIACLTLALLLTTYPCYII